jgi:hypothetical protein
MTGLWIAVIAVVLIAALYTATTLRRQRQDPAYTSACTRVYADAADEAHLLAPGQEPGPWQDTTPALCGMRPDYGCVWLGARPGDEAVTASAKPLCGLCGRIAASRDKTQRREGGA